MVDSARLQRPVILKPSPTAYFRVLRKRAPAPAIGLLALVIILTSIAQPEGMSLVAALLAPLIIATVAGITLYFARARIVLQGESVRWRKIFRHGSFSLDEVAEVKFERTWLDPGLGEWQVIVFDRRGRRLLRLLLQFWSDDAVAQLREFLNRRFYIV